MRIANPLYDHAFKYLMANQKLAKKVISTILDEEIVDLELHQQEILEKFMTLFNQAWVSERNYILDLEEVPEEFEDIASYLQRPLQDKAIREKLALEAEAEMVFAVQEARVKQAEQKQQEAEQKEQEEAKRRLQAEQKQQEAEQKQQEEAKRRLQAEQKQQEAEQREQAFKVLMVRELYKTQLSIEEIARTTNLNKEQIQRILNNE